jgi:hypothetical protein
VGATEAEAEAEAEAEGGGEAAGATAFGLALQTGQSMFSLSRRCAQRSQNCWCVHGSSWVVAAASIQITHCFEASSCFCSAPLIAMATEAEAGSAEAAAAVVEGKCTLCVEAERMCLGHGCKLKSPTTPYSATYQLP